ncbi:MAG: Copper resistance protein B, partial [uncultured Sphingomonadaceae bacterium]
CCRPTSASSSSAASATPPTTRARRARTWKAGVSSWACRHGS